MDYGNYYDADGERRQDVMEVAFDINSIDNLEYLRWKKKTYIRCWIEILRMKPLKASPLTLSTWTASTSLMTTTSWETMMSTTTWGTNILLLPFFCQINRISNFLIIYLNQPEYGNTRGRE